MAKSCHLEWLHNQVALALAAEKKASRIKFREAFRRSPIAQQQSLRYEITAVVA